MAVMAVEAPLELVSGAESSSALAVRSKAGGRLATRKGGGLTGGYFGGVTAPPRSSQLARATTPAAKGPGRRKTSAAAATGAVAGHSVNHRANIDPTIEMGTGWHRIVMAEFIAAIFILVFAPILTPDGEQSGSKGFFRAADIVRMTAVCLVFFILALLANGEKLGKVAAAFGGLVLTGVIYNNAIGTQSIFTAIAAIFTSAFNAQTASDTTAPIDPDLVYGQVGSNIFTQLSSGGTPAAGASATAPASDTTTGGVATTGPGGLPPGAIEPVAGGGGGGAA